MAIYCIVSIVLYHNIGQAKNNEVVEIGTIVPHLFLRIGLFHTYLWPRTRKELSY